MALRPKPAPLTFSNKAQNFYSSEYPQKTEADDGLAADTRRASNGHMTQSLAKDELASDPKLHGNFEMQRFATKNADTMRTTASGASISHLMSQI